MIERKYWTSKGVSLRDLSLEGCVSGNEPFKVGNVQNELLGDRFWIRISGGQKPVYFNTSCHGGVAVLYLLNHLNMPTNVRSLAQNLREKGEDWVYNPSLRIYPHKVYMALFPARGPVKLETLRKSPKEYVMWLEEPKKHKII